MTDSAVKIEVREFSLIRDLIQERTGIFIRNARRDYLEYRVVERMSASNITSPEEYYYFLKYSPGTGGEFQALINLITVQETSFFRNPEQLGTFRDRILGDLEQRKKAENDTTLRLWSSVCSTGEEPLTMAMIATEALTYSFNWDIEVLASDISTHALDLARKATYPAQRFADMDADLASRYFSRHGDNYVAKPAIMDLLKFRRVNLTNSNEVSMVAKPASIDVIFCRNVFIYFPDMVQQQVAATFFKYLRPGGYLLLGNAESIDVRKVPYQMTFFPGGMIYQKPFEASAAKSLV